MSKRREIRSARVAEVAEDGRTIVVRAVAYGVVDDYGSVWQRGVFARSVGERMPVFAWSHNWEEPIGRAIAADDREDGFYLTLRASNPEDVPRARQAVSQFADGTLTDVSVGFSNMTRRAPTDEEVRAMPGAREIMEDGDLDEVSAVLRGAVPGAQLVMQRSGRHSAVDVDAVVELAKRVTAGELTQAEAAVALELLGAEDAPTTEPPVEEPPVAPDTTELDAAADEALALVLGRSAYR